MGTIGLFDSGIGGLSVLKVLYHHFPRESFLYFADNAYQPYGEKTEDKIRHRSHRIIEWMVHQKVKLIVVACHTSSSVLENSFFPVPVITQLTPSLDSVFSRSFTKGLGIIATSLTVTKGTLARYLTQKGFLYPVHTRSCPELVPLIESQNWMQAQLSLYAHVNELRTLGVDYILYGCTHYPFLDPFLDANVRTQMIDPAYHLVSLVHHTLGETKESSDLTEQEELTFYHTGSPYTLSLHLERLGWDEKEIKNINLDRC